MIKDIRVICATPMIQHSVYSAHTLKDCREYLKAVLNNYKSDYKRGMKVKEYCYWINKDAILVHKVNNDGSIGDTIKYYINH